MPASMGVGNLKSKRRSPWSSDETETRHIRRPAGQFGLFCGQAAPDSRRFVCAHAPIEGDQVGALAWRMASIGLTGFKDFADLNAAIEDAGPGEALTIFTVCLSGLERAAADLAQRSLTTGETANRSLLVERKTHVMGWQE